MNRSLNESVCYRRTRNKKRIERRELKLYPKYLGHIAPSKNEMELLVAERIVPKKYSQGRSPNRWPDQATQLMARPVYQGVQAAKNRHM